MNNINLIGNLTRDPHFIPAKENKSAVAFLTVANNDDDKTIYVEVTVFGKTAEYTNKHLTKSTRVAIEGKLAFRPSKTKEGSTYDEMYVIGKRLTNLSAKASQEA